MRCGSCPPKSDRLKPKLGFHLERSRGVAGCDHIAHRAALVGEAGIVGRVTSNGDILNRRGLVEAVRQQDAVQFRSRESISLNVNLSAALITPTPTPASTLRNLPS